MLRRQQTLAGQGFRCGTLGVLFHPCCFNTAREQPAAVKFESHMLAHFTATLCPPLDALASSHAQGFCHEGHCRRFPVLVGELGSRLRDCRNPCANREPSCMELELRVRARIYKQADSCFTHGMISAWPMVTAYDQFCC